MYLQLETNT